jgi:hypothetical protein
MVRSHDRMHIYYRSRTLSICIFGVGTWHGREQIGVLLHGFGSTWGIWGVCKEHGHGWHGISGLVFGIGEQVRPEKAMTMKYHTSPNVYGRDIV